MIPYVIQQTENGEKTYDIYSRLLKERIIFLNGEINSENANIVIAGTLKENTKIIYVTNENKDSVKATIGGTTYTGLQSILYDSRKSSGAICIRIIGEIDIPSKNTGGQIQIKENKTYKKLYRNV